MKFYLGAISPKQPIILKTTFYQMLEVVDLSWRFFLPNELVPRYFGELSQEGLENLDTVDDEF